MTHYMADTNGDGQLSTTEIHKFLTDWGQNIKESEVQTAVDWYDENDDGVINKSEWEAWIADGE